MLRKSFLQSYCQGKEIYSLQNRCRLILSGAKRNDFVQFPVILQTLSVLLMLLITDGGEICLMRLFKYR